MTDDKILTQYLHELLYRSRLKRGGLFFDEDRVEDALSTGLQSLVDTGRISDIRIWLVFGASVLVDIWKILGSNVDSGYKELLRRGGRAKAILGLKSTAKSLRNEWQDCKSTNPVLRAWISVKIIKAGPTTCIKGLWNESCPTRSVPIVLDPRSAARNAIARRDMGMAGAGSVHGSVTSLNHGTNSPTSEDRLKHMIPATTKELSSAEETLPASIVARDSSDSKNLRPVDFKSSVEEIEAYIVERKINTELISVSYDPAFYDNHNLINCGIEAIQLSMNMEAAGLDLTNTSRSLLAMSHLVNAARQLKLLEEPWKALDKMVSLHINRLFSGALPTTAKEMHSRLCVVVGFSPSAFARDNRSAPKFSGKHLATISHTGTSKVLHRYFTEQDEKIESTLIEAETQYLRDHRKQRSAANGLTRNSKRHSTLLEVLTNLRDFSQRDIQDMDLDYVNMNRSCAQLTKRISARIKSELDIDHQEIQALPQRSGRYQRQGGHQKLESIDPVIMALLILKEVNDWNSLQENKKRLKEPPPEMPPQLAVAAKVIQEFIREIRANEPPQTYEPFPIPNVENTKDAEWQMKWEEQMQRSFAASGMPDTRRIRPGFEE